MWQIVLWIEGTNLNKNTYITMKFNKIHQKYKFWNDKWKIWIIWSWIYIYIQMHFSNAFVKFIFISRYLIGIQYMMIKNKQTWIPKNNDKNLNQQIAMDFWMTKFGFYFQIFLSWSFILDSCLISLTCMSKTSLVELLFV
jgi:hypothetical protein